MKIILSLIFLFAINLFAENNVYTRTYNTPFKTVYPKLLQAMNSANLIVVSEINILEKFKAAGLPKAFGSNFNTNNLTEIKAVIVCNGWFGNEVANRDPQMMAFCPIRITVIEKNHQTTVTYVKATSAPKNSKAYSTLEKLTKKVIYVIDSL